MSGIDEGIPICPKCVKIHGIIEHPTYWRGVHPVGNIWFVSPRFVQQSPQYAGYSVVFSISHAEKSREALYEITGFECGWSTRDKNEFHGTDNHRRPHYYCKGEKMFDVVFNRMLHYYDMSGGVFLK